MDNKNIAKWQREFRSFIGIKSGIILEGNILDKFLYDGETVEEFVSLDELMFKYGSEIGAEVVFYNPLHGFYCYENSENAKEKLAPYLNGYICKESKGLVETGVTYMPIEMDGCENKPEDRKINISQTLKEDNEADDGINVQLKQVFMSEIVLRAMLNEEPRCGENGETIAPFYHPQKIFVLNFASRLKDFNLDHTAQTEMFMNLLYAVNNAQKKCGQKNMVVMIVDKRNDEDIPAWLYLNNPNIRMFYIENPDRKTRRSYMPYVTTGLDKYQELAKTGNEIGENFVAETDGLLCSEIEQLLVLAQNQNIEAGEIKKAIKMYKYGVKESPWEELESDVVDRVNERLETRVKGQELALDSVKKVIMRAVKGLSGLQHSNADSKPRGVLFFAGPTGVGKTETAKAIAETIFGDEDACVRFDMSEYRQEHSDQKLLGAPPGYVGYDGGGQLTNAVKNHPFSVLLFDEIEKAHPSIMDKFLQILEDGRMTDNQGNTVYFSESIIIFTSNIGMTELVYDERHNPVYDERGNIKTRATITIENPFEEDTKEFKEETIRIIKEGVKNYFVNIGRPELLNRLGENNIVVFNFIDKYAAKMICSHQVENIVKLAEGKLSIKLDTTSIKDYLTYEAIAQRANGGRGIGNMLEAKLINPLSAYICEYKGELSRIKCTVDESGTIVFGGE